MIKKIFIRLLITLLVVSQISIFNSINASRGGGGGHSGGGHMSGGHGGGYGNRGYGGRGRDWGGRGAWAAEGALIGLDAGVGLGYDGYDDYDYDYEDVY